MRSKGRKSSQDREKQRKRNCIFEEHWADQLDEVDPYSMQARKQKRTEEG
jgi:hypothetical protein